MQHPPTAAAGLRRSITAGRSVSRSILHTLSVHQQVPEVLEKIEAVQSMLGVLDGLSGKLLKMRPELERIEKALERCIGILRRLDEEVGEISHRANTDPVPGGG